MTVKSHAYFLMVLLLLVIGVSLTMQALTSKLLPILIGGITFVLVAVELARELRSGSKSTESKDVTFGNAERRGYLMVVIWIGGFLLAIFLLGFIIAIAIFVFAYTKTHGTGWLKSALYMVFTTGVIYGLFQYAMKVELYRGIVFSLFS